MRLTDAKTGEKLSNFQRVGKGGVIIADRAYGTIAGMEYLEECGSDYLLRHRGGAFNLYNERQERAAVRDFFQTLEAGASGAV
ncbi:MAG: transposase, partial [Treponema sp.]|nr:transposase [Treponema sp.]